MADRAAIDDFLAQDHVALVGASRNPKAFSATVHRELRDHGHHVHPVNPEADVIDGDPCCRAVDELPAEVRSALVMTASERSAEVVRQCIDHGITRIWLHRGVGPSSVSEEAIDLCRAAGISHIDGECPLMFAEPAGLVHRIHRFERRVTGKLPT
jgi:predicted CoA-binding protein